MASDLKSLAMRSWPWVLGTGVILGTIAAWSLLPVEAWVRAFVEGIDRMGPVGVLAFAAVYVIGTVLLAPASVMSVAAGLAFGFWGVPFVIASGTTAAALAFLLARYVARARVEAMVARKPVFQAVSQAIDEEGWRIVGLVRLSPPIPFGVTNYVFGVTKVGFWPFVLTTAAGILPATIVYVNIGVMGQMLTGGRTSAWQWALLGAGILAAVAVSVIVTRKARAKLNEAGGSTGA